jgi:hypothetical protein
LDGTHALQELLATATTLAADSDSNRHAATPDPALPRPKAGRDRTQPQQTRHDPRPPCAARTPSPAAVGLPLTATVSDSHLLGDREFVRFNRLYEQAAARSASPNSLATALELHTAADGDDTDNTDARLPKQLGKQLFGFDAEIDEEQMEATAKGDSIFEGFTPFLHLDEDEDAWQAKATSSRVEAAATRMQASPQPAGGGALPQPNGAAGVPSLALSLHVEGVTTTEQDVDEDCAFGWGTLELDQAQVSPVETDPHDGEAGSVPLVDLASVPAAQRSWHVPLPGYSPTAFTAAEVLAAYPNVADAPDPWQAQYVRLRQAPFGQTFSACVSPCPPALLPRRFNEGPSDEDPVDRRSCLGPYQLDPTAMPWCVSLGPGLWSRAARTPHWTEHLACPRSTPGSNRPPRAHSNPSGRTGMAGRGMLDLWGPNQLR